MAQFVTMQSSRPLNMFKHVKSRNGKAKNSPHSCYLSSHAGVDSISVELLNRPFRDTYIVSLISDKYSSGVCFSRQFAISRFYFTWFMSTISVGFFWVSHRLGSGKTEIKGDVWPNTSDYKHSAFLSENVSRSTLRPVPRRPSPITTLNDLCSDPVCLLICYDLNCRTGELLSLCLIRIP